MLVPIAQPKLQHNRQKLIGSSLQSSVRYEDDGWFAGWWMHTFDFESTRTDYVSTGEDVGVFKLQEPTTGLIYYKVYQGSKQYQLILEPYQDNPAVVITCINDSDVRITGTTSKGNTFSVLVNIYEKLILTASIDDSLEAILSTSSIFLSLLVERKKSLSLSSFVTLNLGKGITYKDTFLPYSYSNGVHHWGTCFQYTTALISNEPTLTVLPNNIIRDITPAILTTTFEYTEKWDSFTWQKVQVQTTNINNNYSNNTLSCNRQNVYTLPDVPHTFIFTLPIWIQCGLNYVIGKQSDMLQVQFTDGANFSSVMTVDSYGIEWKWACDLIRITTTQHTWFNTETETVEHYNTYDTTHYNAYGNVQNNPITTTRLCNVSGSLVDFSYPSGGEDGDAWSGTFVFTCYIASPVAPLPLNAPLVIVSISYADLWALGTFTSAVTPVIVYLNPLKLNPHDALFVTAGQINIPLCVMGASVVRVNIDTTKTRNSDKSVITGIETVDLNDAQGRPLYWRIDNKGSALKLVEPVMNTFARSTEAPTGTLRINFTATSGIPFYILSGTYIREDVINSTSYPLDGAYPEWIKKGKDFVADDNAIVTTFYPSADTYTIVVVTFLIESYNYISSSETIVDWTRTAYNSDLFSNINVSIDTSLPVPLGNLVQTIKLKIDNNNYTTLNYHVKDKVIVSSGDTYNDYELIVPVTDVLPKFTRQLKSKAIVPLSLTFTSVQNTAELFTGYLLSTHVEETITLVKGTDNVVIKTSSGSFTSNELQFLKANVTDTLLTTYADISNKVSVTFLPQGVFYKNSNLYHYERIELGSLYDNIIFDTFTLYLDKNDAVEQAIRYKCKDIRDNSAPKEIYKRDLSDIIMFIKQFWSNTIDVENYWWVDSTHVLALTKYDLILYVKTDKVDAWMGDKWDIIYQLPRSMFITINELYYSCTSAYKTTPVFYKLSALNDSTLVIEFMNIFTRTWRKFSIPIIKRELGSPIVDAQHRAICSYSPITASYLISAAKKSATCVDMNIIVSFQLSRGLKQWTVVMNNSQYYVITGYGCVGVDGLLTGGEIPSDYCTRYGFEGTIHPVNKLPEESETVPTILVGTESVVWFVQPTIRAIIVHLQYRIDGYIPVLMDLNNNYTQQYWCSSGTTTGLYDIAPFLVNVATLLGSGNAALNTIIGLISPNILTLNPKYTIFGAINHSLGQYSYVWKNSQQQRVGSRSDKSVSFGKYHRRVDVGEQNTLGTLVQLIINNAAILENQGEAYGQYKKEMIEANKKLAAEGKPMQEPMPKSKFTALNMAYSAMGTLQNQGSALALSSTITSLRTLEMFYSVSDDTQCYAGAGFVNHNLKAVCVAQSITDTQIDGKKYAMWAMFASLSETLEKMKVEAMKWTIEGIDAILPGAENIVVPIPVPLSGSAGAPIGIGIAAALMATRTALAATAAINNVLSEEMTKVVRTLGGYPDSRSYVQDQVKSTVYDLEAPHLYGNKSMSLFYPAFGVSKPLTYTDESVATDIKITPLHLDLAGSRSAPGGVGATVKPHSANVGANPVPWLSSISGDYPLVNTVARGVSTIKEAPVNMAIVEGTTTFLDPSPTRDDGVGVETPVFPHPPLHDYCIDKEWSLSVTAGAGNVVFVSCDDIKILDGEYSNIVITDTFCGVASSYTAIEIKKGYDKRYLRPTLLTPNTIGLNINKVNCVYDAKAYHAHDGIGNRITKWTGSAGMDKELLFQQYCFQINDHFKRSNILPPSQFFGSFEGAPSIAVKTYDKVANVQQEYSTKTGTMNDIPGENKNLVRLSTPVHSELLSTLPAIVRTLSPYKLNVVEGVTTLTTDNRSTQSLYKAPTSIDFGIGGRTFRATNEFISSVKPDTATGILVIEDIVPISGMSYIGATTTEAYFYAQATKMFYTFDGEGLSVGDTLSRFVTLHNGIWDFVNQEVILAIDNVIVRLDRQVLGEVSPPIPTIGNSKLYSTPGGLVYQGAVRAIVNRFIVLDYMAQDIIRNKRKWVKVPREEPQYERVYRLVFEDIDTFALPDDVKGWTYNPFVYVTSMLGTDEETDNKFEWVINFAWTPQMDLIYGIDEYACVNLMAETVTQGGVVCCRPTHVFLYRQMFGDTGYYSFKYNGNNGIGNREKLYLWSDALIAISDVSVEAKEITKNRMQPLVTQIDIQRLQEL